MSEDISTEVTFCSTCASVTAKWPTAPHARYMTLPPPGAHAELTGARGAYASLYRCASCGEWFLNTPSFAQITFPTQEEN